LLRSSAVQRDHDAGSQQPAGVPPALSDDEEANYTKRGGALTTLGGASTAGGGTGHTSVGAIAGFPDWFSTLQNTLINRMTWTQREEDAQGVLKEYAGAARRIKARRRPPASAAMRTSGEPRAPRCGARLRGALRSPSRSPPSPSRSKAMKTRG